MRRFALALGLIVGFAMMAGPASAADWTLENMGTKLGTGLNGILTSPGDLIMGCMEGSSLTKLPGATNLAGVLVGGFEMVVRAVAGTVDLATFIVPEVGMISPKPRFTVVPGTKM